MAIVPAPVIVVARGAPATRQRWLARVLVLPITLTGAAMTWAAWGLAPWYGYALGVATAAYGAWLQVLVELSGRERLIVGADGSLRIHSPALLSRDVTIDRGDIASVTYAEAALNQPPGETLLSLLGRGGHLRVELREPRVLAGTRWTNWVWCLRAESDPHYVAPPLPRTAAAVLTFPTARVNVDAAVELFAK